MTEAIRLRGLRRVYAGGSRSATVAVDDVDLVVAAAESVAIVGASGCGKSTLLRLIAGLDSPTSGEATVLGMPAGQARAEQAYGMVLQEPGLLAWRTALENVELPLVIRGGIPASERSARATAALERVGLGRDADRDPWELSGGMAQRVALARAIVLGPRLLLMDEPFSALDELTRERMQGESRDVIAATGAALVLVTHSVPEAAVMADRVVVMSRGRLTGEFDARGIDSPAHPGLMDVSAGIRAALAA